MRLDVSRALRREGTEMPFALDLTLNDQIFSGEEITFTEKAHIEGIMIARAGSVTLMGEFKCDYMRPCCMCLEPQAQRVECEFEDTFNSEPDPEDPNDLFVIADGSVDITGYAESLVFLDMPMVVKCKPDCKGLCPVCGQNLNISQCSCGKANTPSFPVESGDSPMRKPFAALQDLLSQNEEV